MLRFEIGAEAGRGLRDDVGRGVAKPHGEGLLQAKRPADGGGQHRQDAGQRLRVVYGPLFARRIKESASA